MCILQIDLENDFVGQKLKRIGYIALGIILGTSGAISSALSDAVPIADVDEVYPFVPSWPGLKVLHIGDSHVSAGLKRGMARRLKSAGSHYYADAWVGSRAKSWVVSGRLKQLLRKHRPDAVVITLGTNAMQNRHPDRYAGWVHALVSLIKGKTCYWLGPPPLIDDTFGFNKMLLERSKPCRFFDSRVLQIPKRADGKFHLTKDQGERWAAQAWTWMNDTKLDEEEEGDDAL